MSITVLIAITAWSKLLIYSFPWEVCREGEGVTEYICLANLYIYTLGSVRTAACPNVRVLACGMLACSNHRGTIPNATAAADIAAQATKQLAAERKARSVL